MTHTKDSESANVSGIPNRPRKQHEDKDQQTKAETPTLPTSKPPRDINEGVTYDLESMFKSGFLAEVYRENPIGSPGVDRVVTRFPPEPNGFLHLGHSKAIAINFGFARHHGGVCYLRYDDTNPAKEEEKYFTAIAEIIQWLGFKPVKVTYSSDYFDNLYELAEDLIRRDGAYVCHCSKSEIAQQRGGGKGATPRFTCRHRDRPSDESLAEFRAMRDGKYGPQEALLRMKQDMKSSNPQMWDLTAYRVIQPRKPDNKESPDFEEDTDSKAGIHYRTGDKWKIYPTYDFTHCLVDSFEGITHSLCTTEFELSRTSYNWLCDTLGVYRPMQREYGRLNLSSTVLSKRKIMDLISNGHVRDWDDPRLYTLIALRRRGVPPGAILSFVSLLGASKATTTIEVKQFEQCVRQYLEFTVPRLMVVLDPIPVIIDNLPEDYLEMVELPFSKDPQFGSHRVPFTRTIYIDRADFRETPSKDFFRLTPDKSVGLLKVPFPITATSFEKDPNSGLVTSINARYDIPEEGSKFKKPKAYIHWISDCPSLNSPIKASARVHNPLFTCSNPDSHPAGFLAVVNPNSEEIFPNAMIEIGLHEIKRRAPWPKSDGEEKPEGSHVSPECVRFQGMRVAYFCLDRDSSDESVVLNRIVSLKEDAKK
ncbi:glutaminyl-tRNA synthetase [Talaromyces proteolyticus]|uniref:glutamine--tRNA ligase n=1 Tax=Talaromyces proteolyticus TaxID=1131652 RepID=A0AAD4KYG4_9EURO|nr:glutaminyl-tRNA synthetase [Talaromyces proteolyticus]KAH8702123.1 glutaminyl-tRNA synthetase [Talaromyces proteolyticus]